MFVRSSRVYYSASDLKAAVECEWALMRKLDAKLGRIEAVEETEDAMLARASILGGEHEARALANYRTTYAEGVVEIDTEDARADPEVLRAAQQRTIEALYSSSTDHLRAPLPPTSRFPPLTRQSRPTVGARCASTGRARATSP
jgi:predicted RecB family nuclease